MEMSTSRGYFKTKLYENVICSFNENSETFANIFKIIYYRCVDDVIPNEEKLHSMNCHKNPKQLKLERRKEEQAFCCVRYILR